MQTSPIVLRVALSGALGAGAILILTGCAPPVSDRLSNQGGGSIVSVTSKIISNTANPPIGSLTPDEWQIIADNITLITSALGLQLPPNVQIPQLSDAQAQAVADFLEAHNIVHVSDLEALREEILSGEIPVPAALIDLLASLGVDTRITGMLQQGRQI